MVHPPSVGGRVVVIHPRAPGIPCVISSFSRQHLRTSTNTPENPSLESAPGMFHSPPLLLTISTKTASLFPSFFFPPLDMSFMWRISGHTKAVTCNTHGGGGGVRICLPKWAPRRRMHAPRAGCRTSSHACIGIGSPPIPGVRALSGVLGAVCWMLCSDLSKSPAATDQPASLRLSGRSIVRWSDRPLPPAACMIGQALCCNPNGNMVTR